jgi:hypothetical protein
MLKGHDVGLEESDDVSPMIDLEQCFQSIAQVDNRAHRRWWVLSNNWGFMRIRCVWRGHGRCHPAKKQPHGGVGRYRVELLKVALNGG